MHSGTVEHFATSAKIVRFNALVSYALQMDCRVSVAMQNDKWNKFCSESV